ncbi:MAG: response regulator [Cephaloticoccus sp.]|nr:response regulator [Cephaloticoccus sp.]MCF7760639.1 response regulator [Cephaloticoccus sp.]
MKEFANKSILIIDDDTHFAATLAMGLEANGCRTLSAPNAEVGLQLALAHLPDLILCDIEMPGMDGSRLLREMRKDSALADRQFVLMTGKADYANPRVAMDLGADDFLLKPFTLDALLACVAARFQRVDLSRRLDEKAVAQLQGNLHADLPQLFFKPLAVVLGLTEMLQKDFTTLSPEEVRQDLGDIHRAGRRLHRSLRNYLRLLELETARGEFRAEVLAAEQVVDALSRGINTAKQNHQRSQDVMMKLSGATLRVAPVDLAIMAEELVDNALTYSRTSTQVHVSAWVTGIQFHLSVSDVGRGLTPPQLVVINSGPTQPKLKEVDQTGMGMGLTLVQLLAKIYGGEFRIESEAGRGSTSHLLLPVAGD